MDKSMSGWRPKISKLGSLPTHTYELRKPVSLRNTLKKSAECESEIIVHNGVVQNPEIQIRKKCCRDTSKLPGRSKILVHAASIAARRRCKT